MIHLIKIPTHQPCLINPEHVTSLGYDEAAEKTVIDMCNGESFHVALTLEETVAILQETVGYYLFQDGNRWCAVQNDFVDLEESVAGFGVTPVEALENLVAE